MKWTKASVELPLPGEEVLIRFHGMALLATYDQMSKQFIGKTGIPCTAPIGHIIWASFVTPEHSVAKEEEE